MAFVLEDGTGISNSNAYIAVATFTDHHTDRNVTEVVEGEWGTPEIQSAIINGSDYVDKRFSKRYRGYKQTRSQNMEWPRISAFDDDGYTFDPIPRQLEKAVAEYALLILQLDRNLAPVPSLQFSLLNPVDGQVTSEATGTITETREVVGPIEEWTKYSEREASTTKVNNVSTGSTLVSLIPEYPQADLWMDELLTSTLSRMIVRG